ncbi:hypothetical protein GQ457_01G029320 [Hibiscus cannabinus]
MATDIIDNDFSHHVFLSDIICETHPVPLSQVQIELTITVTFNFRCFDRVPVLSLPVSRQESVTFDLLTLWEDRDQVRRILAPALASVRLGADTPWHDMMVDKIIRRALVISDWTLSKGFNCKVLPLDSLIETSVSVSEGTIEFLMGMRALAELERDNHRMVAAQESSVREMVTRVRVEDGGDEYVWRDWKPDHMLLGCLVLICSTLNASESGSNSAIIALCVGFRCRTRL